MRWMALLALVSLAGCTAVRGTFGQAAPDYRDLPVEALRETASEIEAAVAEGRRDVELTNRPGVIVASDVIEAAVRSRAARHELLDAFRDSGNAWERRDGTVWVISSKEYARSKRGRERDRDALLVNGENENRWALYEELIDLNDWSPRNLPAIQVIFQEARIPYLGSGQLYESESGERVAK